MIKDVGAKTSCLCTVSNEFGFGSSGQRDTITPAKNKGHPYIGCLSLGSKKKKQVSVLVEIN